MGETDVGSEILEIPVGASIYIKKQNNKTKNKEKQQPVLSVVTECL